MEGFLFKRGELVKTWRARYFVLRSGSSPLITYFRAIETGEGPAGSWRLEGCRVHLAESTGFKKYRFIFEDSQGQRTHLAAHTAKERHDWMTAITAATARSGSAGASSSRGGTPVASSHKQHQNLTHTPSTIRRSGDAKGLVMPCEVPLQAMNASAQAAIIAEAAAEAATEDTFSTPLPSHTPRRRASADIPIIGPSLAASPHLKKALSYRDGVSRSPSGLSGTPFTPAAYKGPSQQQLHRKQSIFSAIKGVLLRSAQSDSTSGPGSEDSLDASSNSNAYNASLKPLKSKPPERQLLDQAGDMLPAEAILEQFDRAHQYVLKNRGEFTAEQQDKLQGWMGAVQASRDKGITTAVVAAAAMFVLVVTRANDEWASWSEHDNMFVSPENMISEVQKWPSQPTLEDLKECLDYCSTSWVGLYCRLGGAHLLLEALSMHRDGAQEGHAEAHDAVLASLQCMQALTSGGGGMDAAIAAPDFVQCLCSVLDPHDQDCSKLVVEMLTKLCLYSADGYCAAIQTILGETAGGHAAEPEAVAHSSPGVQHSQRQTTASPTSLPMPPPPPPPACGGKGSRSSLPPAPPPPPPASKMSTGPSTLPSHSPGVRTTAAPPPPPPPPGGRIAAAPPPPPPPPPLLPPTGGSKLNHIPLLSLQPISSPRAAGVAPPPPPPPPPPRLAAPSGPMAAASTSSVRLAGSASLSLPLPPPPPPPPPTSKRAPLPLIRTTSEAASLPDYPPPPGPPPTAMASTPATLVASSPAFAAGVTPASPIDPGHLVEPGSLLKGKDAEPTYKGQSDCVSIIASASSPPALSQAGCEENSQQQAQHAQQPLLPVEFCSTLLAMMTWNHLDSDLCQHVITLINRALDAPDGPHKGDSRCSAPRQRLVVALLDQGLMKTITDLQDLVQESLFNDLETMKMTIKRLLAPAKRPVVNSPTAPPPPAPAPPKRPPPPPPPGLRAPPLAALVQPPKVPPGPRPTRKMKSFFWDKLPENRLQGTFWEDHPPPYSALHTNEIETLFQAMQRSAKKPASIARQKLAVLDLKRATAVGIRMSRLRVAWQKIPHAIIKLDPNAFQTGDDVRAVLQCVPTQDEGNLLQSYVRAGGKLEGLSDAELFCLELMKIQRVEARLSTFLARFEAQQQLAEAKGMLEGHLRAHQELKGSPCMAAALQLTLAMGNFLNWGTRLGQGAGFRLRNLPKLQDTKSLDGKASLLSYIAHQLSTGHPPAALLAQEVPHVVGPALRTSVQEVTDMIDKVSVAIELVRSEVKRSKPQLTVSLTVASCVQSDNEDQQLVTSCSSSVNTVHSLQQSNISDHQKSHADNFDGHQQLTQQQQQQQQADTSSDACKQQKKESCQQQSSADHPHEERQKQQANHLPGTDQSSGNLCRQIVLVELVSDNYQDVMSQTVREVDKELKLARRLLAQCKESFHTLVSFYGENAQAFANDAVFWSDVVSFVEKFTACQRQLRKQMQEKRDMAKRKELRRSQTAKGCPPSSPAAPPCPAQASCSPSSASAAPAADLLPCSSASAATTPPSSPLSAAAVAHRTVPSPPSSLAVVAAQSPQSSSSALITGPASPCVPMAATSSISTAVAHRDAAGAPAPTSSSPAAAAADLNTFAPSSFSVVAASEPVPLQHTGVDTAYTGHDPASALGVIRPAIAAASAVSSTDTASPRVSPSGIVATPTQMPTSQIAPPGSASHDEMQPVVHADVDEDHTMSVGHPVNWKAESHTKMGSTRPGNHHRSCEGRHMPKPDSSARSLASYRLPDTLDHDSSD